MAVFVQIHNGGIVGGGGGFADEGGFVVASDAVDDAHVRLIAVNNLHRAVLVEVEGGHGGGAGEIAGVFQPHLLQGLCRWNVFVGGDFCGVCEKDLWIVVVVHIGEQSTGTSCVGAVGTAGDHFGIAAWAAVRFPNVHAVVLHYHNIQKSVQVNICDRGEPVGDAVGSNVFP